MADWPRRPLWSAEKPYTKQQAPDAGVPDTGDVELTDLLLPPSDKAAAGWVGWKNHAAVQVDVDLGRPRPVGFCQAWMLRRDVDGIPQATSLAVYGSNTGTNWTLLGSAVPGLVNNTAGWVEVTCTTLGEWRYARFEVGVTVSGDTWIYVGELQVYGHREHGSTAQAGTADAGSGLEFLYHMNMGPTANEPDYSGKGRTLTRTNDPPSGAGVLGTSRKSSYEAGTGRLFTNGSTGNIAWGTAMTVMFWLNRAVDVNALAYRMAVFLNPGYTHFGWFCGGAGLNKQWWIRLNNAAAGDLKSPDVQNIPMNAWYHFAATYDGAHIRLYVNGNLVAKKAYGTAVTTTTYLRIGADNLGYYYPDAWIDEVLGFTRVLSEAEIRHYAYHRHGRVA